MSRPFLHRNHGSRQVQVTMALLGIAALGGLVSQSAQAMPSYARQTGQECASCHVGGYGPQLTPFGIKFKLGGYADNDGKGGKVPLSAMLVGSYTHTDKDLTEPAGPHDKTNDNTSLQEVSAFLAGGLGDHAGSFVQVTWSDIDRTTVLDNAELRYADTVQIGGKDTLLGVSVNNNPTMQDPFNTLGSWRFPYTGSELAPGPAAGPMIDGGLEHQVIGANLYGLWDDSIYAELGGYRSLSKGLLDTINVEDEAGRIDGVAPYGRIAYFKDQHSSAYSVGMYAMATDLQPGRVSGPSDKYYDVGIDGSYTFLGNREHIVTINGSLTHEHQILNATYGAGDAEHRGNNLNKLDLSASYFYQQTYGVSVGLFDIWGDRDQGLYAAAPDEGSRTGKPDSNGLILQADWTPFGKEESWNAPWANLRLGLQYTLYNKYNGADNNYDGYGRDAGDNNTLFAFLWTAL